MNKYILKYASMLILILCVGMVSCDDRDDEITELHVDRVLTPYKIKYGIENVVDLTLRWEKLEQAEGYVVEIYSDSLEFKAENFFHSDEVLTNEFRYTLLGNTQYSARIKSVSTTNNDSKWNGIAFKTGFKSVFLPPEVGDITTTSIKFRFPKGTPATEIVLIDGAGEKVTREVTDSEIAAGIIEFTDLQSNIQYTAKLYNGKSQIGEAKATTISDGAINVTPVDDLKAVLEGAEDGDEFLLANGTYLAAGEVVKITKKVTISGTVGAEPTILAQFELESPSAIEFKHVILDGDQTTDYAIRLISPMGDYGSIVLKSSQVRNYKKSLIGADKITGLVSSIEIDDCIVTDILTDGAEAIDVRAGYVPTVSITNSTFNNVAPARSLLRLDDSSKSFPDNTGSIVTLANCTFHKVTNSATAKGILYVRFTSNTLKVSNNIFSETSGIYSKEKTTSQPIFEGNNYFKAPNLIPGGEISGSKVDNGVFTTEDPQYEDAANGNFKVGNGMVQAGDPRWR